MLILFSRITAFKERNSKLAFLVLAEVAIALTMNVVYFRVLMINGTKTRRWSADKGYDAEVTAFLRAVRGESPLEVTVLDGVRATAVALRAIEAAATATRLAVDWRGCL